MIKRSPLKKTMVTTIILSYQFMISNMVDNDRGLEYMFPLRRLDSAHL